MIGSANRAGMRGGEAACAVAATGSGRPEKHWIGPI